MADIFFNEAQKKLKEETREFVSREIIPRVREIDEKDRIPPDLLKKLTSPPINLTALSVPKRYGGLELDKLSVCIIAEEIGYGCPALIPLLEIAQLFTYAILLGASEEQKKRYLTRIADGEIGCYALTDEGPGSDPANMKTTATKTADGYVLNGTKRLITFADMADMCVTFAKLDSSQNAGISAFIMERKTPGLKLEKHVECFGLRGHRAYNLKFDNINLTKENLLGKENSGLKIALEVLNNTRISLAWGYVGLARAAIETAIKFSKERLVGGKPICENQAISFPIAELVTSIDAARLLAYRAAVMAERGVKHRKETSMAKFFAGEVLIKSVTLANRILAGYGCDRDYPVERYLRDAFSWISAQGTLEVQKLVISREVFS